MFELSPVGMTLIDLESGAILEHNQAFLASTGYSAEEAKTLNYRHFTPKEFIPVIRQQVEIMLREGIYGPIEIERIRKDGQRIPVLLNGLLVEDDQGRQMAWSFQQDISEMKRREQRISELNEELKAINEQKDQLFSIISHDLRGSVGNTDLLLDFLLKAGTNFQDEIQELIQNARQSSAIAKSLLEDLLLWSRSQMNTIDFKPLRLSLQPIVSQVFASLEAQADFKHLHLVSDIPAGIAVNADKEMLKVILRNLVSNAIKFSYPEGTIKVMANEKAGMVYIAVQDDGMGISPENLGRLFDNSKHLTTQGTRGEKGSGVGLNLCKEFVKKHGGEITAVSQLKKGTTFTFSLPEAKPDKR
jgi:PAS domain S-box-containing protein